MTKPTEIELHVGHYGDGTGAHGIVDEVKYARKFIKRIYDILVANKVPATYYEDKTSKNQTQNINNLIAHHNKDRNGLIVSGHLNSTSPLTDRPIGVEVLYSTQKDLAIKIAKVMSDVSGLANRGAKYRDNIGVLTRTYEPSILIEFGFVNSRKDVDLMDKHFEVLCQAIAEVLAVAIGHTIKPHSKEETSMVQQLLNATGRNEIREMLKKARRAKVIDAAFHTDEKIAKYNDIELLSYQAAVINRTFN
ncbi:N-acetylmuramoyl-L-alanine amidase [Solibacillus sp. FSL K6-1523]|uniref:N-acetylmuramoyl-L-alanine amidase n=1 Tax=Solibacillus sp. FSL K6-1523 TaxID=2921471 RepID=UPI0030F809BD